MALTRFSIGTTVIEPLRFPSLQITTNVVENGGEVIIQTPKLGNVVTFNITQYSNSAHIMNTNARNTQMKVSTYQELCCTVNEAALAQLIETHAKVHFSGMDALPKSLMVILDSIHAFAERVQQPNTSTSDPAISQALFEMLNVLNQMSENIDKGVKHLITEKSVKKIQTAVQHRNFLRDNIYSDAVAAPAVVPAAAPAAAPRARSELPVVLIPDDVGVWDWD